MRDERWGATARGAFATIAGGARRAAHGCLRRLRAEGAARGGLRRLRAGKSGAADAAPRPVGFLPETFPGAASCPAGKSPGAFPRNPFFGVGEKSKRLYGLLHYSGSGKASLAPCALIISQNLPRRRSRPLALASFSRFCGSLALRTFQCSPLRGSAFQCCAYCICLYRVKRPARNHRV